jgi:hypothetical protein
MNTLTNLNFKRSFSIVKKFKPFYQLSLKAKFRRDIQPGLTRYNWDQLDYDKQPAEVNKTY